MSTIILFQGDSITDGNRGRDDDPNHILGRVNDIWRYVNSEPRVAEFGREEWFD